MEYIITISLISIFLLLGYGLKLFLNYKSSLSFQIQLENIDSLIAVIFDNMYTNKIRNNMAIDNNLLREEENKLAEECVRKFRKLLSPKYLSIYKNILNGDKGLDNYIAIRFFSLYNKAINAKKINKYKG